MHDFLHSILNVLLMIESHGFDKMQFNGGANAGIGFGHCQQPVKQRQGGIVPFLGYQETSIDDMLRFPNMRYFIIFMQLLSFRPPDSPFKLAGSQK
jgi:hypothetical protein